MQNVATILDSAIQHKKFSQIEHSPVSFDYRIESIRTEALHVDYFLVPWDTKILGAPVGQIADLRVFDPRKAASAYEQFLEWCRNQRIALCSCRLPADRLVDSMFLEERGFRFVELNYLPLLTAVQELQTNDEGVDIGLATDEDRPTLRDMASRVFRHGRFHQDPRIDSNVGDRRYSAWIDNAFESSQQRVLKCSLEGRIVAFFVVESPTNDHCFWSLNGLAPGHDGSGLGKRVWRAMLHRHRVEGAHTVSTSISSHNIRAFNLYVSLGFRFPAPLMTLQWCPNGQLT